MFDSINSLLQNFIVLFTAITIHEYSHGLVAYKLGDPTAKSMGRLTLNPLAHLDPLGALMMIFCRFGWAKPVPVNPYYFNDPKKGMIYVSLAGPISNVLLALVVATLYPLVDLAMTTFSMPLEAQIFIRELLVVCILMNVNFAVFNLIPFPPLDGSKVLFSFLPNHVYNTILTYERYGTIVLMILSYTGILGKILSVFTMPIYTMVLNWMHFIQNLIF